MISLPSDLADRSLVIFYSNSVLSGHFYSSSLSESSHSGLFSV